MKVTLVAHTVTPPGLNIIGCTPLDSVVIRAIAECYQTEPKISLIQNCLVSGHTSVFEHISFTFAIKDVSRVLLAQFTRHRIGVSPTVESQRYTDYSKKPYRYITPPSIERDQRALEIYADHVMSGYGVYRTLVEMGIPKEDARFAFSEATGVNETVTLNARALMHFFELRTSPKAQWEIRQLANEMLKIVQEYAPLTFQKYNIK